MRIITDSAADFTQEELISNNIDCVPMQILFGEESFTAGEDFTRDQLWERLDRGEIGKTSQPSPDAFLKAFDAAGDEDVLYIGISSALSGTVQSAMIARDMAKDEERIHIVDTLSGTAGQKLLVLHACRLRDEGRLCAAEIAAQIIRLSGRVRIYAGLDTLQNLARSGRISAAAASIGTLAQLKPLIRVTGEGRVDVCGKAIGRHRAIDALLKKVAEHEIDPAFPVIPLYSRDTDNCAAFLKKAQAAGVAADERLLTELGATLAVHIGPGAFGLAFVEAQ